MIIRINNSSTITITILVALLSVKLDPITFKLLLLSMALSLESAQLLMKFELLILVAPFKL